MSNENIVNHCRDCCCARSWKALGITKYTGLSIPEHIENLRADNNRLKLTIKKCIDSMQGSNCDELNWLEQALKGN